MHARLLQFLFALPASAQVIFATSYNDHAVTSLRLDGKTLAAVSKSLDCGSEPTWLTLDKPRSVLYCLNEGWGGNSTITSYQTSPSGNLTLLDVLPVTKSPVSSILYGTNNTGLAVAHYDTSTFSTLSVGKVKALSLIQKQTYTMAGPGPVPDRQDVPHLHEAILDPTKKFIIVPDLGADLVRLFRIDPSSLAVTPVTPIKALPGTGPRHAGFAVHGRKTFFYHVNELSNSITGYSVSYANASEPAFTRLFDIPTHGPGGSVPTGTKAAELQISPDQKFLIVSSRGENSLTFPNFDAANKTALVSDPLISFSVDPRSGNLTLAQTAPAGGRNPRGFTLNKAGNLVVSALQDDNRVVVIQRDVRTGRLGEIVAHATVGEGDGNGPNYALFNE